MKNKSYTITLLTIIASLIFCGALIAQPQIAKDNFDGNSTIATWFGDDCIMDNNFINPYLTGINTSSKVLKYSDVGGQYANVRFDAGFNFNLSLGSQFSLKIYVPSSGITGSQNNQISLKLQNGLLASPWETQCEIIKPIVLNQWQTITFDFATDPYMNLNPTSGNPILRTDFSRVVIQINGENNNSNVLAFIDDFLYESTTSLFAKDDFDGNSTISTWLGDDCIMDNNFINPYSTGINTSSKVLKYSDVGGQYANVRFDAGFNFNLSLGSKFSLKLYVPSSGITGVQNNQISLKLQNGSLASPWQTQSEIIKPVVLNQWQTITFDFATDPYINLNPTSGNPILRTDFSRVVIQINGENNNSNVLAFIDDFLYKPDSSSTSSPFTNLVWSDEFNSNGAVNTSNWFYQTQLPNGSGWYNGELQHYTNQQSNSFVSNGLLNIVAKKETFTDQGQTKQYTSARLNSKFAFKYGRVEVRAKLATGAGTWPAIWMLGKNINEPGGYWNPTHGTTNWPACGEIDIMEHWGTNQNVISSAIHFPINGNLNVGQYVTNAQYKAGVSSDFHIYAVEWTEQKVVFSVDGINHFTYNPSVKNQYTWPFDAEQYILLNVAIEPSVSNSFVQSAMEVDYVRVYQKNCSPTSSTSAISTCGNYNWNGNTYSTSGIYTWTGKNIAGCDSVATFNLTIKSNTTSTTNVSLCPSAFPYNWNGVRAAAGTYTFTTTNSQGCDSIATLNLTFKTNTTSTTNVRICPSSVPYTWNGLIFTVAGAQTKHLTNAAGCDSAATLNLMIGNSTSSTTNIIKCGSYLWNGVTYTSTGVYNKMFTSISGCDSTATLNLTILTTLPAIAGLSSVCIGSSIALSNAQAGGLWSSIAGRATVNAIGVVTGQSVGSLATIKYTYTNNGCNLSTTKNITVNAIPATPSIGYKAPFSNPQAGAPTGGFCVGKVFGVLGTPSNGVWSASGCISVTSAGIATINTTGAGSLTYTFTNANGCANSRTMTGTGFACAARGIVDNNEKLETRNDFSIFPNPAKSYLSLIVETLVGEGQIIVTDLYGKTVKTQPLSMGNNIIDIANLNKGMYFISTITNEGKTTKKLVVE